MIEAAIDNWLSRGMPSVHGQISNLKNQKSKIKNYSSCGHAS